MRRRYPIVTAAAVHQLARHALADTLKWKPFRRSVPVADLLDALLLMAATARTLFAVVRRYFPFSHETARQALRANLPAAAALTAGLVDSLHHVLAFSRRDRRRRWTVAIDTHHVPYYGHRATPHIVGGQKKQGTKYFFSYATAVLLHRRRRYTVGLLPLTTALPPHQIVAALLDQVRSRGLLVGGVVLDSGFDSGETVLLLQGRGLSYTVPLRRKGRGTNRRNACFAWPHGAVGELTWVTEKTRNVVATRVLVWRRAGQPQAKVYAFAGWGDARAVAEARRAWLGRRRYRERFGIETSYRQKNQARAWTTSRDVAYRLLLEGLAHLLRQVWVRLTEQVARARGLTPTAWAGCTLADLLDTLADQLKADHPPITLRHGPPIC
jgi:hypothetical protein